MRVKTLNAVLKQHFVEMCCSVDGMFLYVFVFTGEVWDHSFSRDVMSGGWNHSSQLWSVQFKCLSLLCWSRNHGGKSEVPLQGKIFFFQANPEVLLGRKLDIYRRTR